MRKALSHPPPPPPTSARALIYGHSIQEITCLKVTKLGKAMWYSHSFSILLVHVKQRYRPVQTNNFVSVKLNGLQNRMKGSEDFYYGSSVGRFLLYIVAAEPFCEFFLYSIPCIQFLGTNFKLIHSDSNT